MSLYWFAGYLDQTYTINPVRLRGYDAAGNLLYAVRDNAIRDHDLSHLETTNPAEYYLQADFADPYRFVAGYDEWGNTRTLAGYAGWSGFETPQRQMTVRAIAVDSDGWIYCAMESTSARQLKPGVTEGQVRAQRAVAVADGVNAYHAWNAIHPVTSAYYYTGLIAAFAADTERYDRLYVDFFRVYRQNGDRIPFPELHGRPVYAVATDDTYFYLAGEAVGVGKDYLRKYDKSGNLEWSAAPPAWMGDEPARYVPATTVFGVYVPERWVFEYRLIHAILIDGSGNLTLSGHTLYQNTMASQSWIRRYNSSGVLQWERRCTGWGITNVVTDGTLFYVAFYYQGAGNPILPTTYRIDSTDYSFDAGSPVEIVAWDSSGAIVRTATRPTTFNGAYHYLDDPYAARRLEVHDGILYLSLAQVGGDSNPLVIAYDATDLSTTTDPITRTQYAVSSSAEARFQIDSDGNRTFLVVSSASPGSYTDSESQYIASPVVQRHFYRYNDAGTQLWTDRTAQGWAYPGDLPSYPYTEAQFYWTPTALDIVPSPATPALDLAVFLGTPTWQGDRYTECPGLPFRLSLGVPDWLREYVGAVRLPDVYRLYLGTPPLELVASSLTIRRTAFGRFLSAVIAPPGVESLSLVESRIGDDLSLMRGVRFGDGTEQLEPMMTVPLASVRSYRGARALSLVIDGQALETENIPHTRTLTGISYRSSSGARRVRCAIDPYLRPGYTVIAGAESWIVGEIVISLSPVSALMEIVESLA